LVSVSETETDIAAGTQVLSPPSLVVPAENGHLPVRPTRRRPWQFAWPWQLVILIVFLLAWQFVPSIPHIRHVIVWADPFFISSPRRCGQEIWRQFTGGDNTPLIWGPLVRTFVTALIGVGVALVVGSGLGLICSHWEMLNRIARPYLVVLNALPKIALIPVIVLIAGSSSTSDAVVAFISVVFLIFFNAFQGGLSVPDEMMQNAQLLGAGSFEQMRRIRWPYVMEWTFAQIPSAVAFGLVGTVTAELFTGSSGIGQVLITAISTSNADLTFSVVIILGGLAVILVLLADRVRRVVLRWQ
jgi:NitT/TauT family transport system permease protein